MNNKEKQRKKTIKSEGGPRTGTRWCIVFAMLVISMSLLFCLNVCMGSVNIAVGDVCRIISGDTGGVSDTHFDIVMSIRLPRAVAALLLGGALALSGYMLQTFFYNPIAGPFVLGISSGAKMMVALTMVFALRNSVNLTSLRLITSAFAGAMISMLFVLLLSKNVERASMLIVGGVMIGYICSAITDFVVTFADDSNIVNLHNWSLGSFSGITWSNDRTIALVVLTGFAVSIFLSKPMMAYQLGEAYAAGIGVNLKFIKCALVIISSVLAACVAAFAGPISFVGVAVPQLLSAILKTNKPIVMLPASFLGGAVFCLLADLICRTVFAPSELAVSTVTAIFGAPVVIAVMIKKKGKQ